jgi:hypothetical protein
MNDLKEIKTQFQLIAHKLGSDSGNEWVSESLALNMLDIKDARTLRKRALYEKVNFTVLGSGAGKRYLYRRDDIKKLILKNSTLCS